MKNNCGRIVFQWRHCIAYELNIILTSHLNSPFEQVWSIESTHLRIVFSCRNVVEHYETADSNIMNFQFRLCLRPWLGCQ